jgi:hypothetical protein
VQPKRYINFIHQFHNKVMQARICSEFLQQLNAFYIYKYTKLDIVALAFYFYFRILFCLPFLCYTSIGFTFSFIIEGATEKVFQFIMPLKSIYNKNIYLMEGDQL